ncbi:WbqC family protein [Bacteroidales bacterium OttesenSCG-928-B11]|nr:WbqC family protein [Bacteroidales bacterium OttesenSCG-928-E04]MDL2308806.1 WbqC family protein [Bacteroidales bacterium OttesenSCG-928-C03]MDL2312084.1 WbqC family protein [Bacteroidales bacterium OttesenSCG-928-B11]MDL2325694.1 WbqC family protein [Bacteroidales bacterium OttesenSCG-928-A14]
MEKARLFTIAYWPPVSQIMAMREASRILIEGKENFQKQSYRNRMNILSANGILPLSIPIKKDAHNIPIQEVRIDYKTNWQQNHWRAIEAAYNASPYFFYYKDVFSDLYASPKYNYLFEYNMELLARIFKIVSIHTEIEVTTEYKKGLGDDCEDFRNVFHPKRPLPCRNKLKEYPQVFDQKFGFNNELSVIDLICNLGPEGSVYLVSNH